MGKFSRAAIFKNLSEPHDYNNTEVYIKSSKILNNSNGHCKENIPIRKQFKKKSRKWNTGEDLEVLKVANQMIS